MKQVHRELGLGCAETMITQSRQRRKLRGDFPAPERPTHQSALSHFARWAGTIEFCIVGATINAYPACTDMQTV